MAFNLSILPSVEFNRPPNQETQKRIFLLVRLGKQFLDDRQGLFGWQSASRTGDLAKCMKVRFMGGELLNTLQRLGLYVTIVADQANCPTPNIGNPMLHQ
jgi:hypothetical protein